MSIPSKFLGRQVQPHSEEPAFPFFVDTAVRPLTVAERAIVGRLLEKAPDHYRAQAKSLAVVGRCGCGKCPIVFFERHVDGDREADFSSYVGRDSYGGLVAAVLLEKQGRLSQLDFYSIDGHDPWEIPIPETLQPYE